MDKDFRKTFDSCPVCGSTLRFLEELGKELKERKLARPEWNMHFDVRQGVVIDQNRASLMPIGVRLPGFYVVTDICMDCGTVYAIELKRIEGQTQAVPRGGKPPQFDPIRKN